MRMTARYTTALITLSLCSAPSMTNTVGAQADVNLQQAVVAELREDRSLRRLTVSVEGDQVTLTDGCVPHTVTLTSRKPLIGRADDGSCWRIPRRCIASIEPAA